MSLRVRHLLVTCGLILATRHPSVIAVAPEDLTVALARPLSPGAVVLLTDHAARPEAQQRLLAALAHENAAVRAAAARVAFVADVKNLAPELTRVLALETHRYAAVEQVRAVVSMLGPSGDPIALRAIERFGNPTAVAMAGQIARTRPKDIVRYLPAWLAAGNLAEEADAIAQTIAMACAQHQALADEILLDVMRVNQDDFWMHVLDAIGETARLVSPEVYRRALASEDPAVRAATIMHLIGVVRAGVTIPGEIRSAAAPRPIAAGTAAAGLTWEDFARELLARQGLSLIHI